MVLKNFNDVLDNTYIGGLDRGISNFLYGINMTHSTPIIPMERYRKGYVFFTRPQLNLTTPNLLNVREFYPLLTKNLVSKEAYVRTMLDPRLQWDLYGPFVKSKEGSILITNEVVNCPLSDKYQAFIPVLTNTLLTLSGIPDVAVPHMTTEAGLRREQYAMVDGTYEVNDVYEVTATFSNIKTGVLPLLFQMWTMYESKVFEGELVPYVDFISENELDYNTRFYIILLDKTGKYVSMIFAPGAAFPTAMNLGKYFEYDRNEIMKESNKTLDIKFVCVGGQYNDPRLIHEFNLVQTYFNPYYEDYYIKGDKNSMYEVDDLLKNYLNYRCYPYIDPDTLEFKWLVPKDSQSYSLATEKLTNGNNN